MFRKRPTFHEVRFLKLVIWLDRFLVFETIRNLIRFTQLKSLGPFSRFKSHKFKQLYITSAKKNLTDQRVINLAIFYLTIEQIRMQYYDLDLILILYLLYKV